MDLFQSLVDILGSNEGTIALAVAAAVALGTPVVDRLVIRRKRIQYQVLYNSKIGLSPVLMDDGDEPSPLVPPNPELTHVAKLLDRLSVVIVRIRNTGSYDIVESDFEPPLSFTFGPRVVWNARISEASDPMLRQHIRENLEFFTNADAPAAPAHAPAVDGGRNLSTLRRVLGLRMSAFLTPAPVPVVTAERPPQWHGVRLAKMWLRRKQSFILVVVLREADEHNRTISKEYRVTGGHSTGKTIIDERRQRRFGWPVIVPAIGVMLVGALLATLIISRQSQTVGTGISCAAGTVRIEGSSAFGPIAQTLADTYTSQCSGTHVSVATGGSIDGVRDLTQQGPAGGGNLIALSDGATLDPTAGLSKELVAVLVYSVVVNRSVGIDHLTTTQLAGIYSGKYTNWSQLGGPDLPIRIVGRGAGSGTRQALERYVLDGSEGELSSDGCLTRDRITNAPTILCERASTEDLINTVAAVPGAIGYGDVANATTKAAARAGNIVTVELDGRFPEVDSLPDYPFWTVEYLYTQGTQPSGSATRAFLDYLTSDSAQAALLSAGYTPCVPKSGILNHLCTSR